MEGFTLHDQHVHSKYSLDSKQELTEYIEKAIEQGCKYFITTDHIDVGSPFSSDEWIIDFEAYNQEVKILQNKYPEIKILKGVEVGYFKDNYQTITNYYKNQQLDLINLSVHYSNEIDFYYIEYCKKIGTYKLVESYLDLVLEAVNNFDNFQVLSHFDYGFKTAYRYDSNASIEEFEKQLIEIFKVLIKRNKALEINMKIQSFLPIEHTKYILKLYKSVGGTKLTISSDAHSLEYYRINFDKYLALIKEVGFEYLCYYIKQQEYRYYL